MTSQRETNGQPNSSSALVAGAVGGGAVAVALAPSAAATVGFTAAGILAGSPAAAMMSAAAAANGGGVASFSAVAGLQSVGAVGLATSTAAGMAVLGTGAVLGGALGAGAVFARRKFLDRTERLRRAQWSAMPSVVTWSASKKTGESAKLPAPPSAGSGAAQQASQAAAYGMSVRVRERAWRVCFCSCQCGDVLVMHKYLRSDDAGESQGAGSVISNHLRYFQRRAGAQEVGDDSEAESGGGEGEREGPVSRA